MIYKKDLSGNVLEKFETAKQAAEHVSIAAGENVKASHMRYIAKNNRLRDGYVYSMDPDHIPSPKKKDKVSIYGHDGTLMFTGSIADAAEFCGMSFVSVYLAIKAPWRLMRGKYYAREAGKEFKFEARKVSKN